MKEGILWLPYRTEADDEECLDLDRATLLGADDAVTLADEFRSYAADYLSVLNDITSQYK